jgi:MscS family membrane protein
MLTTGMDRVVRSASSWLLGCLLITAQPMSASADEEIFVTSTESPRATLQSFLQLRDEGEAALAEYRADQSQANFERLLFLTGQLTELLDLSSVPNASREEVASDTIDHLLDIFERVEVPPLERVPGAETTEGEQPSTRWRVPGTPLWIVQVADGPREGEFLFSERTITVAPVFYQRIRHLPLRTSLGFQSWTDEVQQLHGPLIPAGLVSSLPDGLKRPWLDTPIWKILAATLLSMLGVMLVVAARFAIGGRPWKTRSLDWLSRFLTPALAIAVVLFLRPLFAYQVNVSGSFAQVIHGVTTLVLYVSWSWLWWLGVVALSDWLLVVSPRMQRESLDADLLRLCARVIGFLGGVVILAYGAHDLGIPVLGVVTGLGIGGLAIALAIRPTLENLIGGLLLFADRPVRVGDFCTFGDFTGTVEGIGIRSTQVRALDRTVISVPNAHFIDMEIVNWARCDKMQILNTIGLRYETSPDQLRYVLASLREMFHAHPKIDRETVRVRFTGYGASSLDVQIRVYALTREWNEFFAIREDVFLRVNDIVANSGTAFAFPSRTLYLGRDGGLDQERTRAAVDQVGAWRRSGRLPFPVMEPSKVEKLADTLDYPPRGSPGTEVAMASEAAESLSTEPERDAMQPDERAKEP